MGSEMCIRDRSRISDMNFTRYRLLVMFYTIDYTLYTIHSIHYTSTRRRRRVTCPFTLAMLLPGLRPGLTSWGTKASG